MANITERFLKTLGVPGKRVIIADDRQPGFAVRVSADGKAVFIYRYRIHGQQKNYTISPATAMTASEARSRARDLAGQVARGIDPQDEKQARRQIPLFKELAQDYLESTQKRSLGDDLSKLNRVLVPRWGSRPVDAISGRDVRQLLKGLTDQGRTPATVNRYRSLISTLFNRAMEAGYVERNPVAGIKPLQENNRRDRWLDAEEVSRLFAALEEEPPNAANAIKMMLFTGQRQGNVLSMRWEDIDLARNVWTIPLTKSGKAHKVPLNDAALALLDQQRGRRELENPHVFPGKRRGTSLTTVQQTWQCATRKAGLENVRVHDLRHSFASHAVLNGVDLYTLSKLLGHHAPTMTARYAHLQDDALKKAAGAVATSIKQHQDKNDSA